MPIADHVACRRVQAVREGESVRRGLVAIAMLATLSWRLPVAAQLVSHIYDITRYELEIRPDFASGDLRVEATIDIANPQHASGFGFGLSRQFQDVDVTLNGRPATVTRSNAVVEVRAGEETRAKVHFSLRGHAMRSDDEDRACVEADSLFLLWSDRFYPIDFVDWAPVKTSILLPKGMEAIAPGHLQSSRETSEGVWHVFETTKPTVKFSIFADRRWLRTERRIAGLRFVTLLHPESRRFTEDIFRTSADVVAFYTALHGYYPADEFTFVTLTGMFARRAFPGFVGYEPSFLAQTMARDGYDGHETALLWWGYGAQGEGPGAFQWTEGFGDYVEILYDEASKRPIAFNLQRAREQFLAISGTPPPLTELRGSTPQPLVHGRLPWMMEALRHAIGDESFRRGIRALFTRYRARTFTLDQFFRVFEEVAAPDRRSAVRAAFRD